MNLGRAIRRLVAGRIPGGTRHCPLCGQDVHRFLPYRHGFRPPLMRALQTVGSNVESFECPRCGAHDRERHLLLYMKATGLLDRIKGKDVLHFAPEKRLPEHIIEAEPAHYVRCDLFPKGPEVQRADLLKMEFKSATFDILIANHVLEHVADDLEALSEIARVVRPGGWVILQTPFAPKLHHTWEDPGICDAESRLQAYGQEDHVRLYGRDIFNRLTSSGLEPDVRTHSQTLPNVDPVKTGVNANEPLFLFHRR